MRKSNGIKEKIIQILRKHPEGLPILELAKLVGFHRHTVTKYVYELIGADVIQIREISTAKVCLLKEKFAEKGREEKVLERLKKLRIRTK